VSESVPAALVVPALTTIVDRVGGVEVLGPDGGPYRTLRTVEGDRPGGVVRVWRSEAVPRIVYVNLDVRARDLDSHMFYAFAPAGSAVPHLTLDAVAAHGMHAFHADLMQRVDLATHVAYLDAVYAPLDAVRAEVDADPETFLPATVPTRGRAMMSPWMLANRLTAETFERAVAPSHAYLEHWLTLVADGLSDDVVASLADTDLAARDALARQALFGADIDPAWDMAAALVGAEPITALRRAMIGRDSL